MMRGMWILSRGRGVGLGAEGGSCRVARRILFSIRGVRCGRDVVDDKRDGKMEVGRDRISSGAERRLI